MGSTRAVPGQTISNHTACDCDLTMDANPTSDDDDDGDDGDCDSGCRSGDGVWGCLQLGNHGGGDGADEGEPAVDDEQVDSNM